MEDEILSVIERTVYDSNVKQKGKNMDELLIPEFGAFEAYTGTENLKRCKSSGTDLIPAEPI